MAPKLWLLLTLLALAGGLAYAPTNYDYLTYRFTRVLYWSWDQHWSWIPTVNQRINYSGTGFEWLMTPLFILFKTDRLFFLINFISYLFLPGLIFSVFSRLGISRRISWWWMWILPCGYCYILQAASAGNDAFAAVYFLASLHYLFRTRFSDPLKNLLLSSLAIALMTEAKASNLPLVLPWVIVLFFHRRYVFKRKNLLAGAIIVMLAASVSFLPTAALNIHFTGDYTGDPKNSTKMKVSNPISGILGNSLQLAKDNLAPPLFPRSVNWKPYLPSGLKAKLLRDFPKLDLNVGELQIEEGAGIGLGIVLFVSLFIVASAWNRTERIVPAHRNEALWIVGAAAIAWLAYMAKIGSEATSRLIAAYYPLLIAGLLVMLALDGTIMQRRLLKWGGLLAILSAFPLVIVSPARPLFPVQAVSALLTKMQVSSGTVDRYNEVYQVYAARPDAFKDIVASIPPDEHTIGFLQNGDDTEPSLWRPFGARKVVEVTPDKSAQEIKALGIRFVVVGEDALESSFHMTIADLKAKWSASLVMKTSITLKAHRGPETWDLLRLDPPGAD